MTRGFGSPTFMSSSRVLITGAAGFIGSHVADACTARGMDVVGIDNLSGGFRRNLSPAAQLFEGDIRDEAFVNRVWAESGPFDYVYHFAAYAAEGLSHHVRCFNYETNLVGSARLINAAIRHQVRHFVFASSIAVYGAGQLPSTEETVPRPEDPYGVAKHAVELDLAAAARIFGLRHTIFRPHNVYGERQHYGDRYRNVVGIFLNQCLRAEPMTILGDGLQTRAFTYIGDIADAIARAPLVADAVNQVFNIGNDSPTRILDLAMEIASAVGIEPRIRHFPARPEVVHAVADHSRLRAVFGDAPSTPLREGVRRMVEWARTMGPTEPSRYGTLELPKNLPSIWE
jgi:UDP-glucose 4-epimerase